MGKLKVAVIGVGHLGKHHTRVYSRLENVTLVGICDTKKKRAKKIAHHYRVTPHLDYKQLLGKVDAVSIAVPTEFHFQIARDFLANGVHVLVEKPITNNLQEASHLVEMARKKRLVLQVGHIERFNSAVRTVESLVKEPKFIECHRLGPYRKRNLDVGVVLDFMIHDIDIILGLIKSKVKSVDAVGVAVLSEQEDIASARLKFENGAVVNLTASRLTKNQMRKIRLFQKDTYISLDCQNQEAHLYKKSGKKIAKRKLRIMKKDSLEIQLQSFVRCVSKNERPIVSGQEAIEALRIALQIVEKIKSHEKESFNHSGGTFGRPSRLQPNKGP